LFACLVEVKACANSISGIDCADFLYHSNIPGFDDTIRIARSDVLTTDRELSVINSIQVTVECLDGKTCSHVPNGQGSVSRSTDEEISEWLEVETVDGISVRSILLPLFE
jgi:hypothetical protein